MCGIIGISNQKNDAVLEIYDGLLMLQHRGQDAAGIVAFDGEHFHERKANGLVKDVFRPRHIRELRGKTALGHVRYPTAGTLNAKEAQPFFVNAPFGIFLIHNGNLTNAPQLRKRIQKEYHRHLRTNSDSEILLNVFADQIYKVQKHDTEKCPIETIFEAAKKTMNRVRGAYSVITMIDEVGMFAFRDRAGIRPLVMGKRSTALGDEWIFASEDVAIKALDFEVVRDVKPGEAILIKPNGEMESHICANGELSPCIFEYVYLARPDSMLDEVSVYKTQLRMGTKLSEAIKKANLEIDSVMPVPDSSRPVALEISQNIGVKYREGLIKNRYVGRTFIMPDQKMRQKSIRQKLSPIELEFRNRNILLVDDSIVRGNTMKKIVEMCRQSGAKKVYVAVGAPPIKNICPYGVDIPTKRELVANGLEIEEIKKLLNIDELFYQDIDDLVDAAKTGNKGIKKFCTGCFDRNYVTEEITEEYLEKAEESVRGSQKSTEFPLINI
ncbi:MAG: amidophosphoribosyltransferase [Candidatus Peregrinibacteria bacterium]|nr:amidophosphoribosyltransferase [Candidatus Peregrinibacteria bacterium]